MSHASKACGCGIAASCLPLPVLLFLFLFLDRAAQGPEHSRLKNRRDRTDLDIVAIYLYHRITHRKQWMYLNIWRLPVVPSAGHIWRTFRHKAPAV